MESNCSLWKNELNKLNKSKRKWMPSTYYMPYRCAELFCENCHTSVGVHDIVTTNLQTNMFCGECVKRYVKQVPYYIEDNLEVTFDNGNAIVLRYHITKTHVRDEDKICYFNSKGRFIKISGKRFYLEPITDKEN